MNPISGDLLKDLKRCGGYYICPKDPNGKRLGPLVGYAGTYEAPDGAKKAYVGDVYYNFAKMEQYSNVYGYYASKLANSIFHFFLGRKIDVVLGAPMGGIILASDLARFLKCRRIFAEKKIISIATEEKREESQLVIARHDIRIGDDVILVEDICNNFSTTDKLIKLVRENEGQVIAIACMINRSEMNEYEYITYLSEEGSIPVISLLHIPTLQYTQEDQSVVDDIAFGNIALKPKDKWLWLEYAMIGAEEKGKLKNDKPIESMWDLADFY